MQTAKQFVYHISIMPGTLPNAFVGKAMHAAFQLGLTLPWKMEKNTRLFGINVRIDKITSKSKDTITMSRDQVAIQI